jgi:hypothetical protein
MFRPLALGSVRLQLQTLSVNFTVKVWARFFAALTTMFDIIFDQGTQ